MNLKVIVRRRGWPLVARVSVTRLMTKSVLHRLCVPFVEVGEFWLSHGFREVLTRSRMRLFGPSPPPAPTYMGLPVDDGGLLPALTIPPPGDRIRASIVIPVLDNAFLTHHCLASIIEHTTEGSYEVIVVDNGSGERTRQMLSSVTGLRLIRNETNAGFVDACNQGARAAQGEFIVFLNNDTVVLADWLDALIRTADRDRSIGAVGAKLIYPDGRLQEAGGIIWNDGHGWNYGRNGDPEAAEFCYVREVDYCSAACLLIRSAQFEELYGFDTRYSPAFYEDVDLCFRLRERGYRVVYQPRAQVLHFEGATAGIDLSSGLKRYQSVNHAKFVERHRAALTEQRPHDARLLRAARDRRTGRRILVVDQMVPHHDEDAGSVRMMALLRMLVDLGHPVTFVPDNLAPIEPSSTDLQQLGIEVIYGTAPAAGFVESHGDQFDIAILCRARFAPKYIAALHASEGRPVIIFDTVDLHFLRERRLADLRDDAALLRSAERTRAVELAAMRSSDAVWVTSTHEAELLTREADMPRVEIVPTIHAVRRDVPSFAARQNLVFIGSFRHLPNEDAVLYFVEEILPLVRRSLGDVRFLIVGPHVPRNIQKLASDTVVVLGHVPDVTPIFDACRVSVAPIRYGAGVKGKITQSLAWGVPAVTTPIGAEGLELVDGEHLLVGSTPAIFAQCVVKLYQDEDLWARLARNGREHVERHLGYDAVRNSLRAILDRALPDQRRTGAASGVAGSPPI